MRFAFAIVTLFPWGGLQRDCLRIARALRARGHEVTLFASRTEGELPADIAVERLPVRAFTNHGRNVRFGSALARAVQGRFDRVVGFDKMPGLDFLYCADASIAARALHPLQRALPRYRALRALEGACFGPDSRTRVLALAEPQIEAYARAWGTPAERIVLVPPNIDRARRRLELRTDGTRARVRAALGLSPTALVLLAIGTQPEVKGFDRAIDALMRAPAAELVIAGVAPASADGRKLLGAAGRKGVERRLHLLGPREDVPELLAASDLLLHAARLDTTGTVILEAIVNGLPVIATSVCGYAPHVRRADAGIVLEEPFAPAALDGALALAVDPGRRKQWSANAVAYGADPELYRGIERAASLLVEPVAR